MKRMFKLWVERFKRLYWSRKIDKYERKYLDRISMPILFK